jgi:hypothetical protein
LSKPPIIIIIIIDQKSKPIGLAFAARMALEAKAFRTVDGKTAWSVRNGLSKFLFS